ncbi:MAG: malto-oligosyltrehalose trehalohydrolase [Gammaproteobacteria bacterium]
MKRRHRMPFGAEPLDDASVRFRLWAPAAHEVALCLEDTHPRTFLTMRPMGSGWFEIVTPQAAPGNRYRYRIDGQRCVPDPASRFNPDDVHGPSQIIDPETWCWQDEGWKGRDWDEAVLYELHVGCFSPQGTFAGVKERLDYLVELGVTALEIMPVADFPGRRNWGYDGVLPFAPDSAYGSPDQFKDLIQSAHAKGLMVLLDVVYNHFGPEGNYLDAYAPQFFTDRHKTPWGPAIDFDGAQSRMVRDFFIHNALYWLNEFHLDGLRLDAVHAIFDDSDPHILIELSEAVRAGPGRQRNIHLVLENDNNEAHYLRRREDGTPIAYTAQWNDDLHHSLHVLLTGETGGYYADYAARPAAYLGRCLSGGFAYQGERSAHRHNRPRGEPSQGLPLAAFVSFLQNHDQIGNRPLGDRLSMLTEPHKLRVALSIVLLAPLPPLLFMGEEFRAGQPFPFFCDFGTELASAVSEGRRREFSGSHNFTASVEWIPDPNALGTQRSAKLDWDCLMRAPHAEWLRLYRDLLAVRAREITPRLCGMPDREAHFALLDTNGLLVNWTLGDGGRLTLIADLGDEAAPLLEVPAGELFYATDNTMSAALSQKAVPPWSGAWFYEEAGSEG